MSPLRKAAIGAVLVGSALSGGAIGATLLGTAGAQTDATTATTVAATQATPDTGSATTPQRDPSLGGHVFNGITERVLTGDTATKAAALAAVPGGTIERVENDAEGATYEAHVTKADGSDVTVKMDAGFKVTGIEAGHGGGRGN